MGVYLCGPTVYDKAHIGHMVGPVIFDCIKRYLTYCGYDVTWVVNITDVDDKLINKANERGITMLEVAEENIQDYEENLAALGVDQIDHFPRATDCMGEIIRVRRSWSSAATRTNLLKGRRCLLRLRQRHRLRQALEPVARRDAGRRRRRGRGPQASRPRTSRCGSRPSRASRVGKARRGARAGRAGTSSARQCRKKLLGESFEIHGGGLDLVFPHHENEIAQSECCHGKPMARYWAHNGLLRKDSAAGKIGGKKRRASRKRQRPAKKTTGGKMSRSKGAGGLADLIKKQGGERIRFFLLRTHYRSTVLFSEPAIEEAGEGLDTFYRLFKRYTRVTGKPTSTTWKSLPRATPRSKACPKKPAPRQSKISYRRWTTTSTRAAPSPSCSSC